MLANCILHTALGLNNGLGRLPGLGWNSDYCTNCTKNANGFENEVCRSVQNSVRSRITAHLRFALSSIPQAFIKHIADSLVSMGFQKLGFHYVNIDGRWDMPTRDANGDLTPNPALWPSGLQTTIDYVHAKGLGFGLYGDKGALDCGRNPGQLGHEIQDAAFFAKHKVDWFKEDSCDSSGSDDEQIAAYAKMRDALNSSGYPVWFALCGWKTFYGTAPGAGKLIGNSWRVGPDTGSGWSAVMENVAAGITVAAATLRNGSGSVGPGRSSSGGAWSDGSLLLNPGKGCNGKLPPDDPHCMTETRSRSMFSLWSTLGFNLLLTGNLSALNPFVIETYSNAEAIAINQDALGYPIQRLDNNASLMRSSCFFFDRNGKCIGGSDADTVDTQHEHSSAYAQATLAECGGEPELQVWEFNTPATSFVYNAKTKQCLNVEGCRSILIYDGCTYDAGRMGCDGTASLPYPNEMFRVNATDKSLRSFLPGSPCVTADAAGKLTMAKCVGGEESQEFSYTAKGGQIVGHGGQCLTASTVPGPAPAPGAGGTLIVGRQLAGGDHVLLMLNNEKVATKMTCDADCFSKLGVQGTVRVRDVWKHVVVGTATAEKGWSSEVEANGGVVMVRLSAGSHEATGV